MPIAKNNDTATFSDYRPIKILPALSKAMKCIDRRQITCYVERNGMISQYQSGSRANPSNSSMLLRITNDLLIASEEKYVSVLFSLDLTVLSIGCCVQNLATNMDLRLALSPLSDHI
jgi:hypothetical protein